MIGKIPISDASERANQILYVLLDAQGTVRTVVSHEREAKLWKLAGGAYVTSVLNVEL